MAQRLCRETGQHLDHSRSHLLAFDLTQPGPLFFLYLQWLTVRRYYDPPDMALAVHFTEWAIPLGQQGENRSG